MQAKTGRQRWFLLDALRAMTVIRGPEMSVNYRNRIKRGVIMASGPRVSAKDLELEQEKIW